MPSLSVCLNVRNKAANLPAALDSVRGVADEIVVCDTGSTDDTIAIARARGARIVEFAWRDDFAAAINNCCSHAAGDWILRLDADERLLPESIGPLRAAIARPDAFAYLLLRQDLVDADRLDVFTEMWVDRLFRRDDRIEFVGRCHAHPTAPFDRLAARAGQRLLLASDVRLRHFGYLGALRETKLRRAAELLALELADRPGQLYYLAEHGRTLLLLGDVRGHAVMGEAMAQVVARAADAAPPSTLAAAVLEHALVVGPAHRPAALDVPAIARLVDRWFPRAAPLLWAIAQDHFAAGRFADAATLLTRLLHLARTDAYDKSISFDPRLIGVDAAFNLAACHAHLGRLDEATAAFDALRSSPTRSAAATQNAALLRALRRGE